MAYEHLRSCGRIFSSVDEILAEYTPSCCIKPGVVLKALSNRLGHPVFLKCLGDDFSDLLCGGVPDEVTITYALQRGLPPLLREGFVRPIEWFRAPVAFHKTRLVCTPPPPCVLGIGLCAEGCGRWLWL